MARLQGFKEMMSQQTACDLHAYEKPAGGRGANSIGNFYKTAHIIVGQAIEADNSHEYEKAYNLYKKSLDEFMLAAKYDYDKVVVRIKSHMKRAEQLKVCIDMHYFYLLAAFSYSYSRDMWSTPVGGTATIKDIASNELAQRLNNHLRRRGDDHIIPTAPAPLAEEAAHAKQGDNLALYEARLAALKS
jgi:hypothetical protein